MQSDRLKIVAVLFALVAATLVRGLVGADTPADLIQLEQQAFQQAVERVAPSVVRIETFGGLERLESVLLGSGPTTGLVVSADGYIISSAFNFVQKPASILVTLANGERLPASIVATDHNRALVLLKVASKAPLRVPEAAPEEEVRPGQWAIAIGRTFDPATPNVSVGVVSATQRIWNKAIQTDAKISPNNYGGPLVDIQGRVLGVLAPLSPQQTGDLAGAEWYDAGIGFAIPLTHINAVLPKLREGKDLRGGLMGLALRGDDIYADPVIIAATSPKSPARAAGLANGDKIVSVNGRPITRQAELRHQVASLYAGDRVKLVVERAGKQIPAEIELVAELPAYEYPFIGILPKRTEQRVVVRSLWPDSPAAAAGLEPGDHINSLAGQPVEHRQALMEALAMFAPGEEIELQIARGKEEKSVKLTLSAMPESVPEEVPPSGAAPPSDKVEGVGLVRFKIPEFSSEILAYVPENYEPATPHGVVVHLHAAGDVQDQPLVDRWKAACAERNLILVAPRAADPSRWQRTEAEFVRKAIDEVLTKYNVDRQRVVLHGEAAGGSMAYLVGLAHRDLVRGVATVDASLPAGIDPPENHPLRRTAVYAASAKKTDAEVQAAIDRLRSLKYPVTTAATDGDALSDEDFAELVRWIDSIDCL